MHVELELRNLPRTRIVEYLIEAGGSPLGDLAVEGDGWSARLEVMEPAQVGLITVPRDRLVIEGHDTAVAAIRDLMERKTMRGGG